VPGPASTPSMQYPDTGSYADEAPSMAISAPVM
jgi:hypothetical protein